MNHSGESNQPDVSAFAEKKIPVKSIKPKKVSFAVQLAITLFLLAILFGSTLFVAYKIGFKENPPTNFDECKIAKGSIIQESYPEVCVSKSGQRFTQEIPEDEPKFCGGIANISCPEGFICKLDGNYPDAGGVCLKEYIKK